MKNPWLSIFAILISVVAGSRSEAQVTMIEAEGNLESNHDIGCSDSLSNQYSPADLYKGLSKCILDKSHERGVLLFALAGVYGHYDAFRVADESAHQGVTVLRMTYVDSLDQAKKLDFLGHLKGSLGNPKKLSRICGEVRTIGPPANFPRYMIQHGLAALQGDSTGNGLVEGFDPESAWEKALDSYLHCPKI